LKALYSKQIKNLVRVQINYITKLEFLPTFKEAFKDTFTKQNIKSRFRAASLVLYNLENVLYYLDLRLKIPTLLPIKEEDWTLRTL
jgi:hypothetical protein